MSKFKNVLIQLVLKVGFNLKVAQSQNILFKSAMQRYLIFAATMLAAVFAYGELPKLEAPTIYAPQYISPHRNTTLVRIAAGAGATVHYTLDGTTPTTGSSVYDGMIDLFNPKTIKAIAVKEGCQSSDVASFRVEKYEQTFEGGESFEVPVGWETVTRSFTVTEKSILRFKLVAESYYGSYYLGEFAYQVNLDGVYFASGYCSSSGPGDQQRDEVYTLDPGHYSITWTFYDYSGGFAGWVKDYAVERAPDSWDVYFDSMGGTRCHTQYYSGRSTFDSLPIPTREPGDEFLGWYWDSSSVQVNEGDSIDSADSTIILWAKWQNIDKALDPAAKFSVCRAQAGQWTESNETLVSYVEDQPLASGESRLVLSYTIDGKALVTMRVFDDGADMASKVYVDDNPIVLYNGKFDIQSEGSHKIEVRAVGQEDNAKLSIRIGRITAEQLPDSVIINLDPNGGTCSKSSIEYSPGMSFGSLPVPVLAGCDFVGWKAEYGDLLAPATPVSMACTKLTAQWKVSPSFLDPDEALDIELNTSCNWIVQSSSSLYCVPPEDGLKSTDEPLLTLHVSGAGLLMMSSLDWRVNVRVDGKLADLVDRTIPLKRDENGSIVSIFGDTVCEILADGEHTVTFHAAYLGGNWSCYLHPMRWQALGEAIEIKLDPAEGSVGKSNIVCNVGGVYGELPVPVCEWGDFVGWYLDACDGVDQSDRQFVDKDTRVSNLYTTLRAAYKVNGRLVDPQGNFDITMCDDGTWSAENIVDRTANWKSRTYYQYDGERPGRKTIMTFVPKQSGILLIDGVRIEGGWMDRLNVKAYIGVETSQYSVDGPWLNLAYSDWDSFEGVELRDCYGYQYRVGVDYIERCPLFVNAGQEYKVIVDMTAAFDRWDVNDFWAGMTIGKFEFEPFLPVTLYAGEHGKFAVGSPDQTVVWCRYSDGPWQQQLKNMSVYMNYDKGWTRTDWEIVGDGQMSAASAIAVYGPAAYEAWYIFDSHYDFPVGTFLPAGSWKHASTYYSYAQNHYNQCSISGFYVSTNENDRVPNVCLLAKDNSANWIEDTVSGPCKVKFDWKVSSEGFHNYKIDYFSFSVDGVEKAWIGGEVEWASREFEISGTGEHSLRWSYVKDESGAEGEDCGRVANIVIVPLVEIAFQASGQEEYGNPPSAFWLYEGETAPLPGAASLVWPRHELAGWSDGKKTGPGKNPKIRVC